MAIFVPPTTTPSGHSHCTLGEKTPIFTAPLQAVLPGGTDPGMQTPSGTPSLRQGGPASEPTPAQQYESPMQSVCVVHGPRILPHRLATVQIQSVPPSPQSEFCMQGGAGGSTTMPPPPPPPMPLPPVPVMMPVVLPGPVNRVVLLLAPGPLVASPPAPPVRKRED